MGMKEQEDDDNNNNEEGEEGRHANRPGGKRDGRRRPTKASTSKDRTGGPGAEIDDGHANRRAPRPTRETPTRDLAVGPPESTAISRASSTNGGGDHTRRGTAGSGGADVGSCDAQHGAQPPYGERRRRRGRAGERACLRPARATRPRGRLGGRHAPRSAARLAPPLRRRGSASARSNAARGRLGLICRRPCCVTWCGAAGLSGHQPADGVWRPRPAAASGHRRPGRVVRCRAFRTLG